jgi:phosphatidylinositol alpha-1,6-mannosyltransferase
MTTLLISENFPPKTGGSSRWFWEIYRRLPRQYFAIAAGEDDRVDSFDKTHDLRVFRLPLTISAWGLRSIRGLLGYWRAIRRLRPLLRSERVTMVHCGRCLPEGLMALALKRRDGVPYACYVHGEDVNTASTSRELTWLVRRVLHGAAFLIPNSRNTERILREEWAVSEDRIRLLHPGVDCERFVPAKECSAARAHLGWASRPVILTVGRLQKRKGHDHLITALATIRKAVPDILYAIVGDGQEREYLHQLVAQHGLTEHVMFLGEVSDAVLTTCYQQCDLFVLPNREIARDIEGFGMVLLEAQACGKPVVAGTSGGTGDTMRVPETGRLVNCDSPAPLAPLVIELLSDRALLQRMGEAARHWVLEHFDWGALSQHAEELFALSPEPRGMADVSEAAYS